MFSVIPLVSTDAKTTRMRAHTHTHTHTRTHAHVRVRTPFVGPCWYQPSYARVHACARAHTHTHTHVHKSDYKTLPQQTA